MEHVSAGLFVNQRLSQEIGGAQEYREERSPLTGSCFCSQGSVALEARTLQICI